MSFYVAIISFLVSVSVALMLLAAARNISKQNLTFLGLLHLMFLFAFLASLVLSSGGETPNYFFLAYICSRILLSGLYLRSEFFLPVKIYFGLFTLKIALTLNAIIRVLKKNDKIECKRTIRRNFLVVTVTSET